VRHDKISFELSEEVDASVACQSATAKALIDELLGLLARRVLMEQLATDAEECRL
jgi:hypothetical protein